MILFTCKCFCENLLNIASISPYKRNAAQVIYRLVVKLQGIDNLEITVNFVQTYGKYMTIFGSPMQYWVNMYTLIDRVVVV